LRHSLERSAKLFHEPWHVEAVVREDLVIGAALGQLRDANA
jgi:hypothetical protein